MVSCVPEFGRCVMCYPFKGLVTTDKVYRKYSTIMPCATTINLFPVSKTKTTGRNIWMDILLCINVFLKVVCTTLNNVHLCVPTNVVFFLRGNRIMMNHMLMYNRVYWKLCQLWPDLGRLKTSSGWTTEQSVFVILK